MIIETIKVYKGASEVIINKTDEDIALWRENGYLTSSERQKKSKKTEKSDK